jgi:hypothetical protein
MLGPIDYIVVGFVGNNFDGSIMEELNKASYEGVIRVVDLMFIRKDANGDIALGEYQDQPRELSMFFEQLGVTAETPIFTEEDALKVAEDMDNDTAAGVLLIEHPPGTLTNHRTNMPPPSLGGIFVRKTL